ncbi:MAG: hypothetical protein H7A23_01750 [Leptospiraceae bacterium]|nr:hypothetical protein [Leptospiraceae bacterium]
MTIYPKIINIDIKKALKNIPIIILSIFFLNNTGNQVDLPQSLPEVTVDATGKTNMSIPIELPVSNGLKPDLSLVYNSNTENGFFGIGWQMPNLATITRDESLGVHYEANDGFTASFGGKLVKIADGTYRTQVETNSKFEPSGTCGSGPCQWKVTDKSGIIYYFGYTTDSRVEVLNLPTGKSGSVKIWVLNKVEDENGNFYTISYTEDITSGFYYPQKITYSDKTIEFTLSTRSDSKTQEL